jgi:hypothetical protein
MPAVASQCQICAPLPQHPRDKGSRHLRARDSPQKQGSEDRRRHSTGTKVIRVERRRLYFGAIWLRLSHPTHDDLTIGRFRHFRGVGCYEQRESHRSAVGQPTAPSNGAIRTSPIAPYRRRFGKWKITPLPRCRVP